jgi:transposase
MESYSMDLRERVVEAYDRESGRGSQARLGKRFGVSPAWVCKLLQRRGQTGDYGPLRTKRGRKGVFTGRLLERLEKLVQQQPDVTLAELRDRTGVTCSLAAICKTLQRLDYRRKKRHCGPLSKIAPTFSGSENSGNGRRRRPIGRGSFSSMKVGRKRT